jgi:hypothetical protein
LSVSVPTVERDWRFARAYLERQYRGVPVESQAEVKVE